jgi:hypothetical protein
VRILLRVLVVIKLEFHSGLILVSPLLDSQKTAGSFVDRELVGQVPKLKFECGFVGDDPIGIYLNDACIIGLLDDPQVK